MNVNSHVNCIAKMFYVLYMYRNMFHLFDFNIIFLSENQTVSHSCLNDMQCTETEVASVCNNGQCECQAGYILNSTNCYRGNYSLVLVPIFVQYLTYTKVK